MQASRWLIVSSLLTLACVARSSAATFTWTGSGGDGLWATASNWSPSLPPDDGTADIVLPTTGSTYSVDVGGDRWINSITFNSIQAIGLSGTGVVTLQSGNLTRGGGSNASLYGSGVTIRLVSDGVWTTSGTQVIENCPGKIVTDTAARTLSMDLGVQWRWDGAADNSGLIGTLAITRGGATLAGRSNLPGGKLRLDAGTYAAMGFANFGLNGAVDDMDRIATDSRGTIRLQNNSASDIDFTGFDEALRLGAHGAVRTFSGVFTPQSNTYRFGGGDNSLIVSPVLGGARNLDMAVGGTTILTAGNTYTGTTLVQGGTLAIQGVSGAVTSSSGLFAVGGTLELSVGAGSAIGGVNGNNSDRIGNSAPIRLGHAGQLTYANGASALGSVSENAGPLTIHSGYSTLLTTVNGSGSANNATLTCDSATRSNRATVLVSGTTLGGPDTAAYSRIRFDTAPTGLIGGGTAAGTTSISILPWMVGGSTLVTYDAAVTSLRPLDLTSEFVNNSGSSFPVAGATANVRLLSASATTYNLTADTTINSLVLANGSGNSSVGGSYKLTLTSGVIAAFGGANAAQTVGCTTVDFAGNEAFVYHNPGANRTLTLSATLTNNGGKGITFTGMNGNSQSITLSSANSLTGPITVNSGPVRANHVDAFNPGSDLVVCGGCGFQSGANLSGGKALTVASVSGAGTLSILSNSNALNIGGDQTAGTAGAITLSAGFIAPGSPHPDTSRMAVGRLTLSNPTAGDNSLIATLRGGTLKLDIAGLRDHDSLLVGASRNVTLRLSDVANSIAGTTLAVTLGYAPSVGDLFKIVDLSAGTGYTASRTGTFSNGATVNAAFGGKTYVFDILYDREIVASTVVAGNDVVLRVAAVRSGGTVVWVR